MVLSSLEARHVAESVKTKLFRLLLENDDTHVSGAMLAKELHVSRNAIWKTVESLRLEGYDISAVPSKGYHLNKCGDALSEAGITGYLKTTGIFQVETRKSVTSTNTVLRELAVKGAPEGFVLAADEQTAGRGRKERSFYSPAGSGAYFSVLLRPGSGVGDATLITSAAAVAAAQAIEEVTGVHVGIKWVNDLFLKGKKVCGILTEAAIGMESGSIDSIVLGIGMNVTRPEKGFPGTLKDVAGEITEIARENEITRCRIIASTLDNIWKYYQNLNKREFLEEYRKRSIIIGRGIYVSSGNETKPAYAIAIDDECRLIVRYENGETATLNSGEVSIIADNR